eukprot:4823081-Alexandrium_andersonii.AAC.1
MCIRDSPDCRPAREYFIFQNPYVQEHGPNNAVVPMRSAQDSWPDKKAMVDYVASIMVHGRPEPPRFVVIAFKK